MQHILGPQAPVICAGLKASSPFFHAHKSHKISYSINFNTEQNVSKSVMSNLNRRKKNGERYEPMTSVRNRVRNVSHSKTLSEI